MNMWNRYRTFEDFEREEMWSTDLASSAYRGLDDKPRRDFDSHGACDDDDSDDDDLDLD